MEDFNKNRLIKNLDLDLIQEVIKKEFLLIINQKIKSFLKIE